MVKRKKIMDLLRNKIVISIVAVVILVMVVAGINSGSDRIILDEGITFKAKRGPLTISVIESGTIKAREQVIIKSQVEGSSTVLSLVPEGKIVKKGDLLIELDASKLVDEQIDHKILVDNAEAAFIRATENLAVVENQAESDIAKADLALRFANLDLRKYTDGEYPNELKEAEKKINLASEELEIAKLKLEWSIKLLDEKYISNTEKQGDELAVKRKKLEVELAENNLSLLKNFTYKRQLEQLESDVTQAEMAKIRTKRKAKADVVQARADLRAKKSELGRQKDKLDKNIEQIKKAIIYAPVDGRVIYASSAKASWRGNSEPLDEGQEVREREELIYLPTATSVKAEIKLHESSLEKVKLGLPCELTVDTVSGKTFTGYVAKIAPLPDAQVIWMNPDLKVYNTEIFIDGDGSKLRTGMSCSVKIIVEEYDDTIYVPIQAVLRVAGKPTVYVVNRRKIVPRQVVTGLDNNRMIRIIEGLDEGQEVLLAPPLAQAEMENAASSKNRQQRSERKNLSPSNDKPNRPTERRTGQQGRRGNLSPQQREKMRQQRQQQQGKTND